MSAGQPTAEDDSWRDTPPIFDAVVGLVIGLVISPESSLRRKVIGIALVLLIMFVFVCIFTVVFLVNM